MKIISMLYRAARRWIVQRSEPYAFPPYTPCGHSDEKGRRAMSGGGTDESRLLPARQTEPPACSWQQWRIDTPIH
jgi:hypothetical protein